MRKSLLCLAVVVVSLGAARADDPWDAWSANFNATMSACVQANGAKDTTCLFKAFQAQPRPPAPGAYVDDELYRDLRTAEVLLHNTDSSNDMYTLFGIDTPDYLGTGYSVPLAATGGPGTYTDALQSEYLVPNYCAQAANPQACPAAEPGFWTIKLTDKEMTEWTDKPVSQLLRAHWPNSNTKAFAALWKETSNVARPDLPPLIIRFQNFPLAYYDGRVGKPDAQRVFFANFEQVRVKTLRQALTATGSASLLANPDPTKTFFIWIYAPGATSPAALATWGEVFKLLSQPAP